MIKSDKIFVAGHKGLVGSAIYNKLINEGYKNLIVVDRNKLDLRNYSKVEKYFKKIKIDYMVMAAAKAGGIMDNSTNQKDFFLNNIEIQNSLLKLALKKKIKRTIYLGTSCIYPKHAKTPIIEDSLLTGRLEKTNECYAIAKIAGIKLCETLCEDHGLDIICLMPTNVYGINDNFDKFNGHVIPAMISKFIDAKKNNKKNLKLFGTGKPLREFIHSNDLGEAIFCCLKISKKKVKKEFNNKTPIINVGTGENISILKLSKIISSLIGFKGDILFDKNFPDGTFRKNLNLRRIKKLGWYPKIKLKDGLKEVINSRFV
jgi:GDP-L-fucose synthase